MRSHERANPSSRLPDPAVLRRSCKDRGAWNPRHQGSLQRGSRGANGSGGGDRGDGEGERSSRAMNHTSLITACCGEATVFLAQLRREGAKAPEIPTVALWAAQSVAPKL